MTFQPTISAERLSLDLTGLNPNPSIQPETWTMRGGHGGMSWGRARALLRFSLAVGGARPDSEAARPGHLGSLEIALNLADIEALRDACDNALNEAKEGVSA